MVLDNFRTLELVWDKANKSIIKTIKAASSDTTGRYLSIKVLDGGQEFDLTDAKLQLYWEHPNFNTRGTDDFTMVDTKGLFKLTFSDEMLTNIGELNAHLVLILSDGRVTSDGFTIEVIKGADDGVVVPTNGRGLVKQIEGKIDKGNVTLNDLTQEVKEALTGGAVAVVGVDAVGTENIKEDAVTTEKIANLSITKEKTDFISVSTNLFDLKKATSGKTLDGATGGLTDNQYMSTSDFIKINLNQEYYFKTVREGRYAFYDENKQFISSEAIGSTVGYATTTSPNNAKYVRLSTLTSNVNATQLNEGNAELPYEPYYAKLSEDVQLPMENNDVSIVRHASGKFRWLEEIKKGVVVAKIEAVYNANSEVESFVETRDGYTITYQIIKDTDGKVIGITQEGEV